jgi:hypothetical protein
MDQRERVVLHQAIAIWLLLTHQTTPRYQSQPNARSVWSSSVDIGTQRLPGPDAI